jgi:hypothetical protein
MEQALPLSAIVRSEKSIISASSTLNLKLEINLDSLLQVNNAAVRRSIAYQDTI